MWSTVRALVDDLVEDLVDAVLPRRCLVCGAPALPDAAPDACARHALVAEDEVPRCGRCGGRLPEVLAPGSRCAACTRRPPRFAGVVCLGDYARGGPLREWILALKHGGRRDLAGPLGRCLAARLRATTPGRTPVPTLLVPVPLHPLRALQRGHDQARLLAAACAEELGVPWAPLLARRRWTPPQGSPLAPGRGANVRGAFAVRRGRARDLAHWRVALVDDVLTSGATADACVAPLARLGARRVQVLCLARAGDPPGGAGA